MVPEEGFMKKEIVLAMALLALTVVLAGCGAWVVEDAEPVIIGCRKIIRIFT